MKLGDNYEDDMSVFTIWSNKNKNLKINFPKNNESFDMYDIGNGYYEYRCEKLERGTQYCYVTDTGNCFPDPASRSQANGVHSYSAVDSTINTNKAKEFKGIDLRDMIIYELHIGTFTIEGTIKAATGKIDYLKELGINCIDIMPLSSFPGKYNWGYDGVFPFAIDSSYGSISDFIEFVNCCNNEGIAVILDVVYNHFGPEGNYCSQFASYFTNRFSTPWGQAISYDGRYSKHVKNYFMENVKFWLEGIKIDGFRIDSPAHIYDYSDKHILEMITEYVRDLERTEERIINIISEHPYHKIKAKHKVILDAHYQEDFHHAFHSYFTHEKYIFSGDYGEFTHIRDLFTLGYCSEFWKSSHYNNPYREIASIQSHDQIGNRPAGERLSSLISYEQYLLSVFAMFTSPFTPLLFMGEEFFETNPFLYFCDFEDNRMRKGVRNGRKRELKHKFKTNVFFDPLDKKSFEKSKLDFDKLINEKHKNMFEFYKILIYLRKIKFIGSSNRSEIKLYFENEKKMMMIENSRAKSIAVLNLSDESQNYELMEEGRIILKSDESFNFKEFKQKRKKEKIRDITLSNYSFALIEK